MSTPQPAQPRSDSTPAAAASVRSLGVALIGYAFMGKAHSNAWRNVASFFDVPAFEQRVVVGRDSAGAAEAAAKHVLVEKPLANTLAEAESMTAAAKSARTHGIQSMIGFNYRRIPALALARELISEGRLGAVRHLRAAYLQDWLVDPNSPMTWRLNKETAGSGALGDIASHAIDQVLFLLGGPVTEVAGRLHTYTSRRPGAAGLEDVTVDDAAWATLSLASGAIASVEVSRVASGQKNALKLEIYGSKGTILFDLE